MPLRRISIAALAFAVAGSAAHAQGSISTIAVEGRSNQNVTVAARGEFVALAWAASTSSATDIYSSVSRNGGAAWTVPHRVNAAPGDARLSGEQPPRIALVPRAGRAPEIAIVWTSKRPAGTRLLVARSTDEGATFGATAVIPGSEAAGNRGWESVAVDPSGKVFVVWLDHRDAATMFTAMHHQAGDLAAMLTMADPVEKAGQSQLLFAAIGESGAPRRIASSVCYCCKTSLVATAGGVYAVWRHVFPGDQRDIGFAASRDGGRTFAPPLRVSEDHWEFNGCPENGPAIAVDAQQRAHVVWPTPADGKAGSPLALFYAMSADGRGFTPRVRIPTDGQAAHVQASIAPDGSLIVAWDELAPGGRKIALARGHASADGAMTFRALPSVDVQGGIYPALAATATHTVIAWVRRTDSGTVISVARITP